MAIHFKIFEDFNLVVSRWDGVIKTDEIFPSYKKLFGNEKWKPGFNQIVDLRNAGMHEVRSDGFHKLNKEVSGYYEGKSTNIAVIAPNDLPFGIARVYAAYSHESSECVCVFRKVNDALNWIGMEDEAIVEYIQNPSEK